MNSHVISVKIKNKSIKYLALDPNAFQWDVAYGDEIKIEIEGNLETVYNKKDCPFLIEVLEEYLMIWLDVIPRSVYINGKRK